MSKYFSVVVVITLICAFSAAQPARAAGNYIFVIMGQSNAGLIRPALQAALTSKYGSGAHFVLCAKGSTKLVQFLKGSDIYNACLANIRTLQSRGYAMAKLFMYQGESDTGKVTNWRGMFLKLIVDLKADTGVNFHTYIFQIGANPRPDVYIYWRSIQQQQHHVSLDTGWPMVMTANIPLCPPTSPHHCAAGYQEITARMMALIP